MQLLENIAKLLREHGIPLTRLPLLIHVLAGKAASVELPLHHRLPFLGHAYSRLGLAYG